MLTRIATWAVGAALVLSTVAVADAAPQKGKAKTKAKTAAVVPAKDQPDPWRSNVKPAPMSNHRISMGSPSGSKSTPMTKPVFERGRIERIDDGAIFYSVEVKIEGAANRPHQQTRGIPGRVMKMARIYTQGVSPSMIKNRTHGDEVELELRQDPYGYLYVTNITSPSAKTQK